MARIPNRNNATPKIVKQLPGPTASFPFKATGFFQRKWESRLTDTACLVLIIRKTACKDYRISPFGQTGVSVFILCLPA
jgi:hypothetical protein